METLALSTFIAVAEARSFSKAAEQLFMTQPAVSKRIAALESELGVRLFDRGSRLMNLTEAGDILLRSARRIIADINTSREEIRVLGDSISGRLRLGTSHHVGIHRLPPVLKAYKQNYPQVELDLLFTDSELAAEDVKNGALELAIVTLPQRADPKLLTDVIWPDPLAIVCNEDHPMAKLKKPTAHVLQQHAAVLPARGTVTRTILLDAIAPHAVDIETSLETNYLETIKMMVSVGLGWSVLPESMIDDGIQPVRINGLKMQRELGCVRLRGRSLSRAAIALMNMLPEKVL
ncbi:MAG: LysR family transcriptional regulator [Gammaproteobacteria bacterium]|nr:LysR family transcriptional regulator [Gammaproteobacteria bacterium]